jgi:hypothetical protein
MERAKQSGPSARRERPQVLSGLWPRPLLAARVGGLLEDERSTHSNDVPSPVDEGLVPVGRFPATRYKPFKLYKPYELEKRDIDSPATGVERSPTVDGDALSRAPRLSA